MSKKERLKLNRLVTDPSPFEGLSESIWEAIAGQRGFWDNDTRYILPALVQESAHEIIIPAFGNAADLDQRGTPVQMLPETTRRRIRLVDKKKSIWKRVAAFFAPVFDELDKRESEIFASHGSFDLRYVIFEENLAFVVRSFYFLSIASKEEAEADIGVSRLKRSISVVKRKFKNDEALFRMNQISGLINLFDQTKIPSVRYIAKEASPSVQERLDELLNEAEIIEISRQRRLMGLKKLHPRLVRLKIQTSLKHLMRKKKYQDVVRVGKGTVSVLGKLGYPLPDMPLVHVERYNPPLVDLKPLRRKIAAELRAK